jgi:hypothetical protein
MVDCEKLFGIGGIISVFRRAVQRPYPLEANKAVLRFVGSVRHMSEQEIFRLSELREPRIGTEEEAYLARSHSFALTDHAVEQKHPAGLRKSRTSTQLPALSTASAPNVSRSRSLKRRTKMFRGGALRSLKRQTSLSDVLNDGDWNLLRSGARISTFQNVVYCWKLLVSDAILLAGFSGLCAFFQSAWWLECGTVSFTCFLLFLLVW